MQCLLIRLVAGLAVFCGAVATCPLPAASVQIVDDLGRTISLEHPAARIIPLYGAFAEMLYSIGAGGGVVARTQADSSPDEILKLPSVGTHMHPNVEMILGLKPDLVVQSGSRYEASSEMDRMRDASVPVAVFEPATFEGIFSAMERLGVLTGREGAAREAVAGLRKRLKTVRDRLADVKEPRRVFFEVRAQPLTGAGGGSIVQEILFAAGAVNSLKSDKAVAQYNFERLLLDNPDVYIVQQGPMNRNPMDPRERPHFERLRSVRDGKVLFVDEFIYSRPGPRCVDAVEELAARLYPDSFESR
jgi:iron complex transport system substrate-binding protein